MELTWDTFNPETTAERILVVAPSLGGNAQHQWTPIAQRLDDHAMVVFVDYPGHALTPAWDDSDEPTLDVVASAVADVVEELQRRHPDRPVFYAGLSIGGATGLHLARDHADKLAGVAVLCSAAKLGEPQRWLDRADSVEANGTQQLVEETTKRWFTPGFRAQHPGIVDVVMEGVAVADDHSYAQLCRSLAAHDVTGDLADIRCPLLVVAGERDASTPMAAIEDVGTEVPGAELHVIPDVAHQVTVAAPGDVATLLLNFMERQDRPVIRAQADD